MAIGADDFIFKFGTQDTVSSSQTTIATTAFQATAEWTNDDDAPYISVVLEAQFDTTMPSIGSLDLYAQLMNIQSTNDAPVPDASNLAIYLGSFAIDFGSAADTDLWMPLKNGLAALPQVGAAQAYTFYLHNNATGQTLGTGWEMYVTPITEGPHA